jgi:von Willebrand factor type A domain/Aerotolerance regulator N-terminal
MLSWLKRTWFPMALIGLFLFALPGVILSILNLFGAAGEVNDWLQDTFSLSYHPALPAPITILALLLPLAIILLYFLKLKRKPLQVPSTFLWKKSIEDLHVNSLFQWLRENILLVLQVLIALFFIYALLGIRLHGSTSQIRNYILVIDNSASMAAKDVAPSRLEWAKEEALKEIDAAGDDDYGMVLVFNSKATTLQTYTNNKGKLREAVRSIRQTQRSTHIEEALSLAESLANPVRSTEDSAVQSQQEVPKGTERNMVPVKGVTALVHLYSDGRFAKLTDAALANLSSKQTGKNLLGDLRLSYHRAGQQGPENVDNIGITGLSAVRILDKRAKGVASDFAKLRVLVQVHNYRMKKDEDVVLHLDVYSGGKTIYFAQRKMTLAPRAIKKADPNSDEDDKDIPGEVLHPETGKPDTPIFELPPMDLRGNIVLHAYLADSKDSFPLDDNAWLVLGSVRKAKILICGPDNASLNAFFDQEATRQLANVERLSAKNIGSDVYRKKTGLGECDLVIFDRCAPETEADMPQANTFFIDRPPPPWIKGKNTLKNPTIFVSKSGHPLMRFLSTLYDIGVNEAFTVDLQTDIDDKVKPLFQLPEGDPDRRTPPAMTKLLETNRNVPVLFTLGRGSYTDLVMTFPLVSDGGDLVTNWPLQPSFPLFLRNVLYSLANVDDAARAVSVQPGEAMVLRPEAGVQSLKITPPGSATVEMKRGNRPEFVFLDTEQLGVYQVQRDDGGLRHFAVNLLDANESNIEPRSEIRIGSERIVAGQEISQPRDLWKWILVLGIILLMLEWHIYNKRVSL